MSMTKSQGTILARLIAELRPEWEFQGILAAIKKATAKGNEFDVSLAAIYAASDPGARTPAFIAENGPHWDSVTAMPREDEAYVRRRRSESIAHKRNLDELRQLVAQADPERSHRGYLAALKALGRETK
jgi:hypothetical protein